MQNTLKNIHICDSNQGLISESANAYYTRILDSEEKDNVWHRLSIKSERKRGRMFRVSIYASNEAVLTYKNCSKSIQDVLCMNDGEERNGFLAKAFIKSEENPSDVLLHDTIGRYLWCRIEVLSQRDMTFDLITVSTPAQTFLKYLPEIYQTQGLDSFVDRFLSIFQTLYEDFENEILHSSAMYDVSKASDDYIAQMADWLAVEDKLLWTSKQLRAILKKIPILYKLRGTIDALSLIIEIFCETRAYFVETFHAMRYYNNCKQIENLYSNNRFTLWVMIFKDLSDKSEMILRHLLEKNKPAHIDARLVILKPLIKLDYYSYLEINSVVSHYPQAALNAQGMLGYTVL